MPLKKDLKKGLQEIEKDSLKTFESRNKEIFNGENNALSEDGFYNGISCKDIEVFQIYFN